MIETHNQTTRFMIGTGLCILAAILIPTCGEGVLMTVVIILLALCGFILQLSAWLKSSREFRLIMTEARCQATKVDMLKVRLSAQQLRISAFKGQILRRESNRRDS